MIQAQNSKSAKREKELTETSRLFPISNPNSSEFNPQTLTITRSEIPESEQITEEFSIYFGQYCTQNNQITTECIHYADILLVEAFQ